MADGPAGRADDALRDRAFEAQRVADGEDQVTDAQVVLGAERHRLGQRAVFLGVPFQLKQGQIPQGLQRDEADVLDLDFLRATLAACRQRHGDAGLALHHVVIGDQVAAVVDEKTRAQAAGGADQRDPVAEAIDQLRDRPDVQPGGAVEPGGHRLGRGVRRRLGLHVEDPLRRQVDHVVLQVNGHPRVGLPQQRPRYLRPANEGHGDHLAQMG